MFPEARKLGIIGGSEARTLGSSETGKFGNSEALKP